MLNDNKSVFLTAGHISLTEKFALNEYVYPGRVYEGIELFIDPETVRHGLPVLRDGFGVELAALREKYCPDGETYIARLPLPDTLSGRLLDNAGAESAMGTVQLKTGVIDLLALLHDQSQPRQPVYYTRSQVPSPSRSRPSSPAICPNPTRCGSSRSASPSAKAA